MWCGDIVSPEQATAAGRDYGMQLQLLLAGESLNTAHLSFSARRACVLQLTWCHQKALVQCYPKNRDLRVHGAENLTSCMTGARYRGLFCKICGVHLLGAAADGGGPLKLVPLNVRAMHGVEWDQLNVTKHNGRD